MFFTISIFCSVGCLEKKFKSYNNIILNVKNCKLIFHQLRLNHYDYKHLKSGILQNFICQISITDLLYKKKNSISEK